MELEDIAFQKMALALKATKTVKFMDELKAAAFEVLLRNPGCGQSGWADILVENYGTELVDTYGKKTVDVYASLEDLWESPYLDENSGLEYDFKTWAEAFATDASVQMYYDLID